MATGHEAPAFALCWVGLVGSYLLMLLGEPARIEAVAVNVLPWFYLLVLLLPVLALD
jgi:hypothetical protein